MKIVTSNGINKNHVSKIENYSEFTVVFLREFKKGEYALFGNLVFLAYGETERPTTLPPYNTLLDCMGKVDNMVEWLLPYCHNDIEEVLSSMMSSEDIKRYKEEKEWKKEVTPKPKEQTKKVRGIWGRLGLI